MKYVGGKARIAKFILPIILESRKEGQQYVEPFGGGMNSIDKVTGPRIAGEFNEYIASMWTALQGGWLPETDYTKEQYKHVRDDKDEDKPLTGWMGICCSYSGKWFGGFAGQVMTKGGLRDYQLEAHRNVMAQLPNLKDVDFQWSSYKDLDIPENSIIYCDPPYEGTTKYKDEFNHPVFWNWCRDQAKKGHTIFVSEYNAPSDFGCVWEKPVKSSLSANGKAGGCKVSVERLFTYKG